MLIKSMIVHVGVLLMHKNKAILACMEFVPMFLELKLSLISPGPPTDALRRMYTYVEVSLVFTLSRCIKLMNDLDVALIILKILFTMYTEVLTETINVK